MRSLKAAFSAVTLALALAVGSAGVASAHESHVLVSFNSMTTVSATETGIANDRGLIGGGKPWAITAGSGELDSDGTLHVSVTGLVIPVAPFNGVNPLGSFGAVVSCITTHHHIVNVFAGTFPTNPAGNGTLDTTVTLPHPCTQAVVFVTSPGGAWFARSVATDDEGDD